MPGTAFTFVIHALFAGVFGFVALAGTFLVIAKVLRFVFLALCLIPQIFGRGRGRSSDLGRCACSTRFRLTSRPEPSWPTRRLT